MVAFLAHRSVFFTQISINGVEKTSQRHVPINEPIDLLNVAFENPMKIKARVHGNVNGLNKKRKKSLERVLNVTEHFTDPDLMYVVPDRDTGLEEVEELRKLCPERVWNFVSFKFP